MYDSALPVHARGMIRGAEVDGNALLAVGADRLRLAVHGGMPALELPLEELEGVTTGTDGERVLATLFAVGGDVIELRGDHRLGGAAADILQRATRFPEVTRGLRGVGVNRSADHDRYFGTLLSARRVAEGAAGWREQLEAFDGPRLARDLERGLTELARARHPDSPPDRRALEAQLLDDAAPLLERMRAVAARAETVLDADESLRLVRWREWVAAVGELFAIADRCWLAVRPVLEDQPPAAPRRRGFWHRLRRGGA